MRNLARRLAWPAFFLAGMFFGSILTPAAQSYPQPMMHTALQNLNAAYTNLQNAAADKGGYRVKAMADIQDAILNVKAGIRWANNH